MRRTLILALALFSTAPVMGQGLSLTNDSGSPAIEGSGDSSTTISGLGDSVSVTLGGEGSTGVYTNSGSVQTDGTIGASIGDTELFSVGGSSGTQLPVFNLDPDGNGLISENERVAAQAFAAGAVNGSGECDGLIVTASSAEQIAAVDAGSQISLSMVCADPSGLTSAQRAAIAANSALMDRLAAAGYGLGDVAGIVLDAEGRGTLYLSAS
jgi:hypothetical protein